MGLFAFCLILGGLLYCVKSSSENNFLNSFFLKNILDERQFLKADSDSFALKSDLNFVLETSLASVSYPFLAKPKVFGSILEEEKVLDKSIKEYVIKPNDTISSIASEFKISKETLCWANDLGINSKLIAGQKLIILPIDGVFHTVGRRETLSEIAKIYKGDISEIIVFNELLNPDDIFPGDFLIIPNGKMPKKESFTASVQKIPVADSYFVIPVEGIISQGPHGPLRDAIDIANKCGVPVVAAASGIVQRAQRISVGGLTITILHPNGVVSSYSHLSAILVKPGQEVKTAEVIGTLGNTGYTLGRTGCHLHFSIRGADNFLAKYPVGTSIKWGEITK